MGNPPAAPESARRELGMVGLGVMGRNFLLNLAGHGFPVAGFDRDLAQAAALEREGAGLDVAGAASLAELVACLRVPRTVMLLVPAGAPVDELLAGLAPLMAPGDVVIDGGNSHYVDTDRRVRDLAGSGLRFFGLGVSGGEEGARHGPSLMPGGDREAYERVRPLLEAAAARVDGEPCVAWLGPGSAGHFVKMVHNGIEYALMELIAECYDLLKRGLGLDNRAIRQVFRDWSDRGPGGFLLETTVRVFGRTDPGTGRALVDAVLPVARQKGTGLWTSQCALEFQVPVPTIDLAVAQRDLSVLQGERDQASRLLPGPEPLPAGAMPGPDDLGQALHAGMALSFAQGLALLRTASDRCGYGLDLAEVARIWRGGCIIRTPLLEPLRQAFLRRPDLANPLLDPDLAALVGTREPGLRAAVIAGARAGLPVPGLMSALAYLDGYRSAWLPANLIQAQRDCFGAHGFERVDRPGPFHDTWEEDP